jgi:hypothetical protein
MPWAASHEERDMKLKLKLSFLLGLTVATCIALHPPAARAQDWPDAAPDRPHAKQ